MDGFWRWFFWSQNAKEKSAERIRRKIRQPKTKNLPVHAPRKSASQAQNPPQKQPTNPPVKPPSTRRVFSIQKVCSWRRLQSMDWDTLWVPFGHGRSSQVEMHLQSLSCCWWADKVCCAPLQITLLVKAFVLRKRHQNKNVTRLRQLSQPKVSGIANQSWLILAGRAEVTQQYHTQQHSTSCFRNIYVMVASSMVVFRLFCSILLSMVSAPAKTHCAMRIH